MIKKKFVNFLFPNFKYKVCSQDFSINELEVDLLSDLVIFKEFFFVDPEPCRPGVDASIDGFYLGLCRARNIVR